jgi:hypothetical protein
MKISRRNFNKAGLGALSLATLGAPALAGSMIRKPIPSTGEMLPVIGLGTNRYGRRDREALLRALRRFHELGGTVIDTAPMYGKSESVLGDLIGELGIREDLFIATKADEEPGGDATDAQMRRSQEALRTKTFDLMQVHNLRGTRDALAKMREWRHDGRIRYIGITTSREAQYEEFEQVMRSRSITRSSSARLQGASCRWRPTGALRSSSIAPSVEAASSKKSAISRCRTGCRNSAARAGRSSCSSTR